jgi:hypothetical protein
MDFKDRYPDFASIEDHIRRAQAERSVAVAHAIAGLIDIIGRGFRKMGDVMAGGLAAERDRLHVETDAFLKRSVPKY